MHNPEKFRHKYRIPTTRLQQWDYGSPGLYFVTICTKNRELYFGQIVETQDIASPKLPKSTNVNTEAENIAALHKNQSSNVNSETQNIASLRATVIGNIAHQYWLEIPKHFPFVELDEFVVMPNHIHGILFLNKPGYALWQPNKFAPQSKNLGSVIRGYKAGVKTFATTNQIGFYWQPRFYDHIIRSEKELNNIRKYIAGNPEKWALDKNNPENLMM